MGPNAGAAYFMSPLMAAVYYNSRLANSAHVVPAMHLSILILFLALDRMYLRCFLNDNLLSIMIPRYM